MDSVAINEFREKIEAAGLRPHGSILADGKFNRVPVEGGKRGSLDGSYILRDNDKPSGFFENFRTGYRGAWTFGGGRHLTEAERREWAEKVKSARKKREAEQARCYAEAAARANKILAKAKPCASHPYLERKGVKPCPQLSIGMGGKLLVPVYGADGEIQSLQTISPSGDKRFLSGGKMAGGFSLSKAALMAHCLSVRG